MKKFIKSLLWIIVILFFVSIIGFVIVLHVVDPNEYKPILEKRVFHSTGRVLKFAGDLHWSIWPFGIEIGKTTLDSPVGFPNRQFMTVDEASVHVNPLFLLIGHMKVSDLTIKGLVLHLIRTQSGATNWSLEPPSDAFPGVKKSIAPYTGRLTHDSKPKETKNTEANQSKTTVWWLANGRLYIPALRVTNATIIWDDARDNRYVKLSRVNLSADHIRSETAFPLLLTMSISQRQPDINGMIRLSGRLTPDFSKHHYTLDNMNVTTSLKGAPFSPSGQFSLAMLGTLQVSPQTIALNKLRLTVNQQEITGFAQVDQFSPLNISFDLKANQLNIDPFLTLIEKFGQSSPAQGAPASSLGQSRVAALSTDKPQGVTEMLRDLKLRGVLSIADLTLLKAKMQEVHIKMVGDHGVIKIDPMTARLYRGTYNGHIVIDARASKPKLEATEKLEGVQIQPLLDDMYSFNKFSGTAHIMGTAVALGLTKNAILGSMNGHANIALRNGSWQGTNLAYYPQVLLSMIHGRQPPAASQMRKTDFSALTASAVIRNGVASSHDIQLRAESLHLDGQGSTHLVTQSVDMLLEAKAMSKGLSSDAKAISPVLPIKIEGTWNDLKYSPQYQAVLTQLATGLIKQPLTTAVSGGKQLGQLAGSTGETLGQMGSAVGNQLGKLGGMFTGG